MPNYENGKIYEITGTDENGNKLTYIGSTAQFYLSNRLAHHICNFKNNRGCSSKEVLKCKDYRINLIELYPCKCKEELRTRERFYSDNNKCVNIRKPILFDGEKQLLIKKWRDENKEHIKQYSRQYYIDNQEHNIQYSRQYYNDNKEQINQNTKQYYNDNKEQISKQQNQYYNDNKKQIIKQRNQYRIDNKEHINQQRKQYYNDNKEQIKQYQKQYHKQYRLNKKNQELNIIKTI
jgi:hypothetical protein